MSRAGAMASGPFVRVPGVYALVDPRTGRVMYIGMSRDIDRRFRQHLDPDHYESNLPKRRWLAELRKLGVKPHLQILSQVEWPEMQDEERQLIAEYRSRGEAELNISDGGNCRSTSKINHATQDDWIELGQMIKQVQARIIAIDQQATAMIGTRERPTVAKLNKALGLYRCALVDLLTKQFPFWLDANAVFYGYDRFDDPAEGEVESSWPR